MPLVALICSTTTSASQAAGHGEPQPEQEARAAHPAARPCRRNAPRLRSDGLGQLDVAASIVRSPAWVWMYIGMKTPSAIVMTFICSPMPEPQDQQRDAAPSVGIDRLICTGPSINASPDAAEAGQDGHDDA